MAEKPAQAMSSMLSVMVSKDQHQAWRMAPSSTVSVSP